MTTPKEKRRRWTDVPTPKCRLCKDQKLHTFKQHERSKKRFEETHSTFSGWVVNITGWK